MHLKIKSLITGLQMEEHSIEVVEKNPIFALTGDDIDILIHGVTCQGILAVGIAKEIGITFPKNDLVNYKYCKEHRREGIFLLSTFSEWYDFIGRRKYGIINLYTQFEPGAINNTNVIKNGIINILKLKGTKKKSGNPLRFGITLIGTEFKKFTTEESIKMIKEAIDDFESKYEENVSLKIYKYEDNFRK